MKTFNVIVALFTALAFGVLDSLPDVTDPLANSMNMNPRKSWLKKDVLNFYDTTKSKDDIFAYSGKHGIKGCVMVNRYDSNPKWLVMTCRGDGEREADNQGGLIVFDVAGENAQKPHVFKNFFSSTSSDSTISPTASVQSSSRFLLHFTTWTDPSSGKLYGIASTGFSWTWPDKVCSVGVDEDNYQCGWATGQEPWAVNSDLDSSKAEDHFDGVVIFDLSDLDQPKEVSRVCLKTKCTEGVSVFFDDSNQAYATVGGVNSEFLAIVDLSDPEEAHVTTQVHKDHINQLVPFYGIHPDTPGYETFANWGLSGGISVWNVKNPEAPVESALLDEVDCSFANRAIFWNERYLLTPLASPVYGGACLFDMCEVNKPRFRSYVHFETLSMLTGEDARTTYGMNAYQDYAYFALQHHNELYTMEIDLDKVYNHVVDDNSDIEYFETESVYLNGYNATSCDVGEEYSQAERMNIMIIAALALGATLLVACCLCYCCCCKASAASQDVVQMTQMTGAGAKVIHVKQAGVAGAAGCGCCVACCQCWDRICDCISCCFIMDHFLSK